MPQALALPFAALASNTAAALGASVAAQATIAAAAATIGPAIAATALTVGASFALNKAFGPKLPEGPKPSDSQVEFKQAVPPRMWHYGEVKVSGPIALYEVGSPVAAYGMAFTGTLYKIVMVSSREIASFEEEYLDDEPVVYAVNGYAVSGRYVQGGNAHVRLWKHVGSDSQTADPVLTDAFTEWTSDHRLRGIAYALITHDTPDSPADTSQAYPQGEPQFKALIRGAKVYDPRLDSTVTGGSGSHRHDDPSTWAYSDNATLCTLDYLTHVDGYDRPIADFDLVSFMAKADLDDEDVALAAGGTEKRYRVATTIYMTEPRKEVLARLLQAGDAELYPTAAGTWAIRGGEWIEPAFTIDAGLGHIIEAEFRQGVSALDGYNELAIQFLSPENGYTEAEGESWVNESDPDYVGGRIKTQPFNVRHVPSHGQARRLAKIKIARDNPDWSGEIRTNFYGLNALGERIVNIAWPELDIDGPFWIEQITLLSDGTGASLSVRSASFDAYEWDATTEEGTPPPVPPDISI